MQNPVNSFLEKIENSTLLGNNAHEIYSPPYRAILSEEEILAKNPKYAAVNILLYQKNGEWFFPLIHRTHNENDRHSGQISFPGGKKDESDADFAETAIRETWEEIGVETSEIKILKKLSALYIPPSNFYVHPFLSITEKTPDFNHQITEVQEILEVPLSLVKDLPNPAKTMELPKSLGFQVPYIDFSGHKIWGATSMILSELSQLLKNV